MLAALRRGKRKGIRMDGATGRAYRIFPLAGVDSTQAVSWFSCQDILPPLDDGTWLFIRKSFNLLRQEVQKENWDEVKRIVGKIRLYQEKTALQVLPSQTKVKAERLYNRISRPMVPFMVCITLGIILFVVFALRLSKGKKQPLWEGIGVAALSALLFAYLTLVLALRWYVSGHAPFAGSYSVMMLMAWLSCIAVLILWKKFPFVQPLGLILAGFTMLVASLSGANPQITHLIPVLQSPLLSVHVLSMMVSYTLFGLVALNGIMGLSLGRGEASGRLMDVSLVILYPAVFLLTFGTFLGAVWANISWGSYWSWDPKETWALITLLIYAFALHGNSLKAFRNPRFFHIFCIVAFISVLVTYFGVNLILGECTHIPDSLPSFLHP